MPGIENFGIAAENGDGRKRALAAERPPTPHGSTDQPRKPGLT
mgnify:CR=1 FL=1